MNTAKKKIVGCMACSVALISYREGQYEEKVLRFAELPCFARQKECVKKKCFVLRISMVLQI